MESSTAEQKSATGDGHSMYGVTMEKAKEVVNTGMREGQETLEKAKEAVDAGVHGAQQKMGETIGMAKEAAANAAHSVADAASYVGHKAEAATSSVGAAMENTGHYLKNDGLQHISSDITEMIRRNPVPAILIGIGLGVLIAQATARRNA